MARHHRSFASRLLLPALATGVLAVLVGTAPEAQASPPRQEPIRLDAAPGSGPGGRPASVPIGAHVPGEVLVKFKPTASNEQIAAIANGQGSTVLSTIPALGIKRMAVPGDVAAAVSTYENSPWVEYAQLNYFEWPVTIPDDPWYDNGQLINSLADAMDFQRWYLGPGLLSAEGAWDVTTGNPNVVIAIIDSGVDLDHPDLAPNIWVNPGEIAGNGIDDDGNGYVDDVNGWDFYSGDNDPNPDLGNGIDDDGNGAADDAAPHGTMVAGIAGGRGNNSIGAAGASWQATVMPLKVFTDDGSAFAFDIANAIYYATDNGANIINLSLGGNRTNPCPVSTPLYEDAINYAFNQGVLVIASAGNDNNSDYHSPSGCTNAISVSASDHSSTYVESFGFTKDADGRASFSNFGTEVDVTAPGQYLWTASVGTIADGNPGTALMDFCSGTSCSAPLVSGLAALMLSRAQDLGITLTPTLVRSFIEANATDLSDDPDDAPDGGADWDGNGMVNFAASVQAVSSIPPIPTPTPIPTPPPTPTPTATPTPTPTATATPAPTATPMPVAVPSVGGGGQWALAVVLALLVGATAWGMARAASPNGQDA